MSTLQILLQRTQTRWQWFLIDPSERDPGYTCEAMGEASDITEAALAACAALDGAT